MDQGWGVEKTSEIQYFKKVDQSLTSPTLTWWTSWSSPGLSWQDRLCDTHKVCFTFPCAMRFKIQNPVFQALDLLSSSSLPLCPPSSPKITEWSKLKPPAERKCDCPMLLAQVGLGRKHILSQLVQSRPNSLTVHCNRLIVIFIVCLMVIVIMCLSLSHHPQLVVTVSISVTFYDCQCHYFFTMSAYIWDSSYKGRSVSDFNNFAKHTF